MNIEDTDLKLLWDKYAHAYSHFYAESLRDIHNKTVHNIRNSNSLIDFGCGVGKILEVASPSRYLGLELNPSMLAIAKEKYQDKENTHFMSQDLTQPIPLNLGQFDSGIMINVVYSLHSIERMLNVFINARNMLKKGGNFVLTTFNRNFSYPNLEKMIERECQKQVQNKEDKKIYDIFVECNRALTTHYGRSYKPLLLDLEVMYEILEEIGFSAEREKTSPIFEGMGELITTIKM